MIDYKEIEAKWRKRWDDAKIFEAEPDSRPGCLVTAAFPYLNMPLHIGHLRTYGTADLYARYLRFRGKNVLFSMGFHKTGTPTLAIAKRIKSNDSEIFDTLKAYGVPEEDISKLTTPEAVADYFHKMIAEAFRLGGLSIDWRRSFSSTDDKFSKMVEWQFDMLKRKGYLVTGKYIIGWCTNEVNAVGQHDTKGDVSPEIEEMAVVEFKDESTGIYYPCATYRPETVSGVTNLFINREENYVVAELNGKKVYLAKKSAEILKLQTKITEISDVKGGELINHIAVNPINSERVPVLHGMFVKPDFATGVVMSVPAHAPFDYAALEKMRAEGTIGQIEYKKVINLKLGPDRSKVLLSAAEIPALAYLESLHADYNADSDVLELATKAEYLEEQKFGLMADGEHDGMPVSEAREVIAQEIKEKGLLDTISMVKNYGHVYCRCGTKVVPKLVEDQWFINYGDEKWKEAVREHMKKMNIVPTSTLNAFNYVVGWLNLRPAERAQGMGTRFPLNPNHIIESLSDSTIYPTLYTYIHILENTGIKAEQLKHEFFDYVYLGNIDIDKVSEATGIDTITIKKCKEQLDYWYSFTSRHSGTDLIYSHLVMYMFNHVGLLPKSLWPSQIVTNGLVNYEGKKMSKSEGNVIPIKEGAQRIGADVLRFIEITTGDLDTEVVFTMSAADSIIGKNEALISAVEDTKTMGTGGLSHIDYWLYSKLNFKIKEATKAMDVVSLRHAYIMIYYESINELRHYLNRGGNNQAVMQEFLEKVSIMLSPSMPHFADEMWARLGHEGLIESERWPVADESMIDESKMETEDKIEKIISDINDVIRLTEKSRSGAMPKEAKVIVAAQWKLEAYNNLAKGRNMREAIEKGYGDVSKEEVSKFLSQFTKGIQQLRTVRQANQEETTALLKDEERHMTGIVGIPVHVEYEPSSASPRAQRATPERPAIEIL